MAPRHALRSLVALAIAFLLTAGSGAAQTSTATLQGTVTDSGGGILPGVTVKLGAPDTGLQREVVTNAAGLYVFNFLPAGRYDIAAELTGFKAVRHADILLEVGQNRTLDITLEVGQVEEVVTVTGTSPLLDTSSPSIGTVIQSSQLRQLPLAGRHWATLMMLAPGAINTGEGTHLTIRFVGRARDDNNWTFDGVDATGVKDPRQDSDARLIISNESIAEFRVSSTLYSAESGSAAGGQVQLISKTGTNQFRGTAYDFVRNDRFDARPFGSAGPVPFRLNQFGANLGGPLVRQRTFFFVNYEGLRQRQTQSFTRSVPSAAFRAAAAPALGAVVAQYPAGTRPTSDPNIDDWNVDQKFTAEENSALFRLDHRLSDATSFFGRYNFDRAIIVNPIETGTGFVHNRIRPSNFTFQLQRIFGPAVVNELKLGYNASLRNSVRQGPSPVQISVPGFVVLTGPQDTTEDGRTFSLLNDLAILRGRHNVKIGGEIRRIFVAVGEDNTTTLSYSSRPNFQINRLENFSIVDFPLVEGQRWWYFGYIQDDIKWRPNLTINAGLRYEYYSVVTEKDDRARVWRIACGGFCPPGTPWYDPDFNNFGPRLGFAWAPARFNDNTVVRAGFGVFFGPGQNDDVFAPIDNSGNRIGLVRADAPALAFPIEPFLTLAATTGAAPRALDEHRVDLYAEHYSLSIQQALPWRLVGQIGYVGNQGHHMLDRAFVNLIDPATGRRPLEFGRVDIKSSGSSTNFHGLQLSLQRPFNDGFLLGAHYMWSHAFDEGSLGAGESTAPQNVSCRRCDYASTNQDIRHTFTMNGVYELPFGAGRRYLQGGGALQQIVGGWQLSGLLQARTGRPLTISVSRSSADLPDGNNSGQRPDRVPGVSPVPSSQTPGQWINPAAFVAPARGTWGNAGRNILRGPGLFQVDLALQKRFPIGSARNVEFRWEAFNAFNRRNLANPITNISAGVEFGRITGPLNRTFGTGTARQMQFMLRINF